MAPSLSKNAIDVMGILEADGTVISIVLEDSKFVANGHQILTDVPMNIIATPSPFISSNKNLVGSFVGFDTDTSSDCHVVPIGKLRGIRFVSIFRFKVWWTTQWTGTTGSDIQHETQMMILDKNDHGRPFVLLLPIIEGGFRSSLRPGDHDDEMAMWVESGSTKVRSAHFRSCLYMHAGDDPFTLVKEAMKMVKLHLGTFKLLEEKTSPGIVDKFGWCTWDAFYLKVNPQGIRTGVKCLVEGGCPPGMLLIDDGWQSIAHDEEPITDHTAVDLTDAGEQMPCRLTKFEENYKFSDYPSHGKGSAGKGLGTFVKDLKEEFRTLEHVYVWHALCGYWGGIRPNVPGMPLSRVISPIVSKGLDMTMEDLAVHKIVNNGVSLVPPELAFEMYDGIHSHLQLAGIDGVKVDVIHLLEMLSEDFGGRIELAKAYYKALTASVKKHFKGNGVIASMEHCNDFMYLGTEAIALGRVGDDFWTVDPSGDPYWLQGCHMVHCAYNSLWMGNFIQPDWDMFQSTHPCAEFHAASRAISGGPIYISDSVGKHNFKLLKSLVFPDGSILRCQYHALPTRDCLFEDPLHDGKTMLKIWNLNKYTGTIGLFNCQGGGWCPKSRQNKSTPEYANTLTCQAGPNDIEWNNGKNPISIKGVNLLAIYMVREKKLKLIKASENVEISLPPLNYELLVVSPVIILTKPYMEFAAIGLRNMMNSGGAIESVEIEENEGLVKIGVKGCGEMSVFATEKPRSCKIDGDDLGFEYEEDEKMVKIHLPWPGSSLRLSVIEYQF